MKIFILCISFLAFGQYCSATNVIAALRNALLDGYEKGAKPDGQVTVKAGATITDFDLCAHREVSIFFKFAFILTFEFLLNLNSFTIGFDNHWLDNIDVD